MQEMQPLCVPMSPRLPQRRREIGQWLVSVLLRQLASFLDQVSCQLELILIFNPMQSCKYNVCVCVCVSGVTTVTSMFSSRVGICSSEGTWPDHLSHTIHLQLVHWAGLPGLCPGCHQYHPSCLRVSSEETTH